MISVIIGTHGMFSEEILKSALSINLTDHEIYYILDIVNKN